MKSQYGDRETVGTIYQKAQKSNIVGLTIGEINEPIVNSLIEDINDTIKSDPYGGRSFYITVAEKRDLQMKNSFNRRMVTTLYRPFPEDNTLVFFTSHKENRVFFCWDIPHWSEMKNILTNFTLYDHDYVQGIRNFLNMNLEQFGFQKVNITGNQVIDGYSEKEINYYKESWLNYLRSHEADEKAIENEKKLGFFWLPIKNFKYKDITSNQQPKISLAI